MTPRPFVHLYFDPSIRRPSLPSLPTCRLCGKVKPLDKPITGCIGRVHVGLR